MAANLQHPLPWLHPDLFKWSDHRRGAVSPVPHPVRALVGLKCRSEGARVDAALLGAGGPDIADRTGFAGGRPWRAARNAPSGGADRDIRRQPCSDISLPRMRLPGRDRHAPGVVPGVAYHPRDLAGVEGCFLIGRRAPTHHSSPQPYAEKGNATRLSQPRLSSRCRLHRRAHAPAGAGGLFYHRVCRHLTDDPAVFAEQRWPGPVRLPLSRRWHPLGAARYVEWPAAARLRGDSCQRSESRRAAATAVLQALARRPPPPACASTATAGRRPANGRAEVGGLRADGQPPDFRKVCSTDQRG